MQSLRTSLFLLGTVLPIRLAAQDVFPTPAQLIQLAGSAEQAQRDRGWKYTFREDTAESQFDKDGTTRPPVHKTYEHIMLEGEEYKKLILVENKPLDVRTQKKVDQDLEKTRAERRKHGIVPSLNRTVSLTDLESVDKYFEKKVVGEEIVLGRKTWRMELEPKPGSYKPANKQEEQALATRQTVWFDQQEGVRIREHIEFMRAANGFQPGSTMDFEYAKVGEEWLNVGASLKWDIKFIPGVRMRDELHSRFYDFKRFTADSTFTAQ